MATSKPTIYHVSTPVPGFTGNVGGLDFVKGEYEGEVPEGPLGYFTGQGYTVVEVKTTKTKPPAHSADSSSTTDPVDPGNPPADAAADNTPGSTS